MALAVLTACPVSATFSLGELMATIRGGDKFEKKLAELVAKFGSSKEVLRVGFLENATYPDGTLVAAVAAYNNFGTRRIPPRPFFSNMVRQKSGGWPMTLANLLKTNDINKSLALMGEGIKGQIQQSIKDTNSPPLSAVTVKAKGFDKPLINTSHMINSVSYEVKK